MTNQQHPITPPPELVQQWRNEGYGIPGTISSEYIATKAAQWGADQELEACINYFHEYDPSWGRTSELITGLRVARRPQPPSLKEQALETLRSMQIEPCWINGINTNVDLMSKYDTIRRALEQLPDDQG